MTTSVQTRTEDVVRSSLRIESLKDRRATPRQVACLCNCGAFHIDQMRRGGGGVGHTLGGRGHESIPMELLSINVNTKATAIIVENRVCLFCFFSVGGSQGHITDD